MKRFLTSLSTISLIEVIGRHPAMAAGMLSLLGVGGGAVISPMLTTPTLLPQISSNFNPNQNIGTTNNGLKPNGGVGGDTSTAPPIGPSSGPTGTFGVYNEMQVDPALGYGNGSGSAPFSGLGLGANGSTGQPTFTFQRITAGQSGTQWWEATHAAGQFQQNASAGSNYATGLYPFTATGGGCAREPSGVWLGNSIEITDPGFGCSTPPTWSAAAIANAGTAQTGITATCASGGLGMLVTTSVPVSPGLSPGIPYALSGFTTTPTNAINATLTATSVTGSGPYTVVGTIAGSCPTISSTGTVGSGTGAAFNFPAISLGGTGITTKNGQHICSMIGELGDDGPSPGFQFLEMSDDKGVALPGSPALVTTPNQGTASVTGWTTIGSTTLNVSGMTAFPITSAAWSNAVSGFSGLGLVTFQVSSNPGFVPGSEFQVSGMSPSSVNGAYIALAGTSSTQVVGNQLTAAGGIPQAYANPGSITTASSPQLVSVIFPGMQITGSTPASSIVQPYGTGGTTGTGSNGSVGTPATYALSASQTAALGGGASPGSTIFALQASYYTGAVTATPAGGTATVRNQGVGGDFVPLFGSASVAVTGSFKFGWGGTLGNFATLYGLIPTQTGGAPSASDLASICTKATDVQAYAAAKSLKVQSLYRLNDPGIWGDSGYATVTGYITNVGGSAATLNIVSTTFGSLITSGAVTAKLTGSGLPLATPATISLNTTCGGIGGTGACAGASYALNSAADTTPAEGSSGSPITFAVGAFAPALPIQSTTVKGYIDTSFGVSTLHVTSLDDGVTHSGFVSFTGTLGTSFTARIDAGQTANAAAGNTLTVTLPTGSPPNNSYIGIGTQVCPAVATPSAFTCATVTALGGQSGATGTPGVGYQGQYTLGGATQNITSQFMFGSGILPGPATNIQTSGTTVGSFATAVGMVVTDQAGSSNLTSGPLLITGVGANGLTVSGNYDQPFVGPVQATLSTIVPGEYIQNSAITNPVKILPGWSACGITGAYPGFLGCYTLSGSPNASNAVGSSGSGTVVITGTTITDGGAIAPGPALTIRDQGPGVMFLVNHSTGTGSLNLSGAYSTGTLGGTPSGIQVLVSNSANGPALAGCTPCNWGALTATISGGAWSGTIAGIPGGGPYFVSVRAANGTAYATLPNSVRIGDIYAVWGQGQAASIQAAQSGSNVGYFSGLWGLVGGGSPFGSLESYLAGPPVIGNFVPSQGLSYAGDRFGITGSAAPLSEAVAAFDQDLSNVYGNPISYLFPARDGVGFGIYTLGGSTQTQTIGSGTGSALTWCSATKFCSNVDVGQPLLFNAASLTGGWFTGSVSGSILTATTRQGGALEPGMVLSDYGVNITGTGPTLVRCLTNCSGIFFTGSTWQLSASIGPIPSSGTENMRADPPGGAPWPNLNLQQSGANVYGFAGFGWPLVKAGTFTLSVGGTPVCQDTTVFAYNNTAGNCSGTPGATTVPAPAIASSFVNLQTGDYQITFNPGFAPASGAAVTASWTNIISPETITSESFNRPQAIDWFGDGTCQSGPISSQFCKLPGGVSGQIFSGEGTDSSYYMNVGGPTQNGYQFGGIGYSQLVSWMFDTDFPGKIPGASVNVEFLATGFWRVEGPSAFSSPASAFKDGTSEQDSQDMVTRSTFSGTVSIALNATVGTLTLSGPATGPMWEGEIVGCVTYSLASCPVGPLSGVYITSLASGAWGASGSVYNLASAAGPAVSMSASSPMHNAIAYGGPGSSLYLGALNDIVVQTSGGLAGTTGREPHPANGFAGGRRATSRWAAMIWSASVANPNQTTDPDLAADPKNDRVAADAGGCDAAAIAAPCFDVGNTYAAVATPTAVSGKVLTFNGLAAHARPIVVGQSVTCSGCSGTLVVDAVSNPPTQSTVAGQGQVGSANNGFTVTLVGGGTLPGGPPAYTFGCSAMEWARSCAPS
jgi:hypothetical protein